jgi:hypothetical protein
MADEMKLDPVRMEKVYKYVEEHLGYNKEQWDLYRNSQAEIESMGGQYISDPDNVNYIKSYSVAGGSGDHYDGRYQLGEMAKKDGAKKYGIKYPGHGKKDDKVRVNFRNDPTSQEETLAGFTVANHTYLLDSKTYRHQVGSNKKGGPIYSKEIEYTSAQEYAKSNPLKRMQYLAHAHNSGFGNLAHYLQTGDAFQDGFNTKSIKYMNNIKDNATLQNTMFADTIEGEIDMRVQSAGDYYMTGVK